jgi:hypothetical protein
VGVGKRMTATDVGLVDYFAHSGLTNGLFLLRKWEVLFVGVEVIAEDDLIE